MMGMITKIVSGGQTGADRAGLDWAIAHGIPHGGWCPKGRISEDGPIADCYLLEETETAEYPERTQRNVRDSDGTVIFTISAVMSQGSLLTMRTAKRLGKPCLHLSQDAGINPVGQLQAFILEHSIQVSAAARARIAAAQRRRWAKVKAGQ